jgi:hypothetical protein
LLNLPSQPDHPDDAVFLDLAGEGRTEPAVLEWIARGDPRKWTVDTDPVIVVTPEDREEERQAAARFFEVLWCVAVQPQSGSPRTKTCDSFGRSKCPI